jgi:hypothetical protein
MPNVEAGMIRGGWFDISGLTLTGAFGAFGALARRYASALFRRGARRQF